MEYQTHEIPTRMSRAERLLHTFWRERKTSAVAATIMVVWGLGIGLTRPAVRAELLIESQVLYHLSNGPTGLSLIISENELSNSHSTYGYLLHTLLKSQLLCLPPCVKPANMLQPWLSIHKTSRTTRPDLTSSHPSSRSFSPLLLYHDESP